MHNGEDNRAAGWIWGILSGPLALMALYQFLDGLFSGTVDNLMARGEPSPEVIQYAERPLAYCSMLGMWLLLLGVSVWLFWKIWLSRDRDF